MISYLCIFSITICDAVSVVTTATGQAGILLEKAVILTCHSRLLILTLRINRSCCCTFCRLAHSLCQEATYKKAKNYHFWTTNFLKVQDLSMEWSNRGQMIHSQQKWIYISNLSRVLSRLMHDYAYVKMMELFEVKLIWHRWEFAIWYRLGCPRDLTRG